MSFRRGSLRRQFLVCLLAGCSTLGMMEARVSAFDQMKQPEAFATTESAKAANAAANAAMKAAEPLSNTAKDALRVLTEHHMALMTEPTIKAPPDAQRNQLLSRVVKATTSTEGKTVVAQTIISKAVQIIDGDYIPSAKINAMLLLIDASKLPATEGLALRPLVNYARSATAPNHLRCLALIGLDGIVQSQGNKMPEAQRVALASMMVNIIKSPPTSLPEHKAHWWMVRRAYEVLGSLLVASSGDKNLSAGLVEAEKRAIEDLMNPEALPSVRLSAGMYLTNIDLSQRDEATKGKLLVSIAQLLDQEVVGWYEQEDDKSKMASGAGAMGMSYGGDMMSGGMPAGDPSSNYDGGMAMSMSNYDSGTGGTNSGPKPIDTQSWDLRLARRKLNTYCQLAHVLLNGMPANPESFDGISLKDMHRGKGIMETALPVDLQRPASKLLEALEQVQIDINNRSLTTVASMMTGSVRSLQATRDAAEMIPGKQVDGNVVVPSFDELSPRRKSEKKADASGSLDSPAAPAAPADLNQADAAADPAQGQAGQPAPVPQPGQQGAPAQQSGQQPGQQPAPVQQQGQQPGQQAAPVPQAGQQPAPAQQPPAAQPAPAGQ